MTESTLSRRIREHANALPATRALKLPGGPMMERGTPDLLVVREGRAIFLEVKVGRNKPSKLQERRLKQWRAAGAVAIPVWTFDEAVEALQRSPAGEVDGERYRALGEDPAPGDWRKT